MSVFVVLIVQGAKPINCIIFSSIACLALPYFFTFSQKKADFRENVFEHQMCFDFLYNICLEHFLM